MGVFDRMIGNWIQIVDKRNDITIADYSYVTGIIKGTTKNHCVDCVAVNRCYFKNEKGKKPDVFDLTKIEIIDNAIKMFTGLYHINCHCKEISANIDSPEQINLIIPDGKIRYLFEAKGDLVDSMGYHQEDRARFVDVLLKETKKSYFYGNYVIQNITNYGCKINLNLELPGFNEKEGKIYKIKTNYMVFPNASLKLNTPIGGWYK